MSNRNQRSVGLSFVLLGLVFAACRLPVVDSQRLRIGTSGDYPPFSQRVDTEPGFRGFDISLAEAFAADRGYRIDWVSFRWPELADDMRRARFDLAMSGVTVRLDRSVLGRFSVPVVESGAVLLYREAVFAASTEVGFDRFDRRGIRVAVNQGGHLERVARARFRHASVSSIADNAAVRDALARGTADVVVTDTLEAPRWRQGIDGVAQSRPLTRDRKAYWVRPGRMALSRELDRWLLEREADGSLARWRAHWFGREGEGVSASAGTALLAALDERLALMPWVAESKRVTGRAVEDPAREAKVLAAAVQGVERAARERGAEPLDPNRVRAFYAVQIEAAKDIQRRVLAGARGKRAGDNDLDQLLRPALIRIGDRIAYLVVAVAQPGGGSITTRDLARALERHRLDDARIEALARALDALASAGIEREQEHRATVDTP